MVLKTERLSDVDFFVYKIVKEGKLNVHLIQLKIHATFECKKESNYSETSYVSIYLPIVNLFSLYVSF